MRAIVQRIGLSLLLLGVSSGCPGGSSNSGNMDGGSSDGGGGGSAGLFEQPEPWTKDISALPKANDSDTIIGALVGAGGWGTGTFKTDASIHVLTGDAATPKRTFTAKDNSWSLGFYGDTAHAEFYEPDCDRVQMPVPTTGAVEGETGYACTKDGDCHLLVVMPSEKKLYEMWRADIQANTFLGGCLAVWDLTKAYGSTLRGKGCSSADAGGFPITAMLATADEAAAGEVKHALRFILPNNRIRQGIYVPPGTHSTKSTSGQLYEPPYGVRFRLKASFDEAALPSQGARIIARALKKYGMFLADGGNVPLTVASDRFTQHKWSETEFTVSDLNSLKVTDFEVVDESAFVDWLADTTCYRNP